MITPGDLHLRLRGALSIYVRAGVFTPRHTDTGEGMRWALVVLGWVTYQVPHRGTGAHQPIVIRPPVLTDQSSRAVGQCGRGQAVAPRHCVSRVFRSRPDPAAAAGWQLVSFGCGRTAHLVEEHPSARARRISGKRESTPGYRQIAAPSRSAIGPAEDRHGRTISERHHRSPTGAAPAPGETPLGRPASSGNAGSEGSPAGSTAPATAGSDGAAAAAAKGRRRQGTGLSSLLLPELQQVAQQMGIAGTGRMRKSQLITAIQEKQGGGSAGGLERPRPPPGPRAKFPPPAAGSRGSPAEEPRAAGERAAAAGARAPGAPTRRHPAAAAPGHGSTGRAGAAAASQAECPAEARPRRRGEAAAAPAAAAARPGRRSSGDDQRGERRGGAPP